MKIETIEIKTDEADFALTFADANGAWTGGGLTPVREVLAVTSSTFCNEIAANSKSAST